MLTKNEERHLEACLHSLTWADALFVVDSESTDNTRAIALLHTQEVHTHRFENFARQRNFALSLVPYKWVLFVDADERVPPKLTAEIRQVTSADLISGYWLPRKNIMFGKWIRHGGWYPDFQLRLFQVGRGQYDERRAVHELVQLEGPIGALSEPLYHLNYERLREFLEKQYHYASFAVNDLASSGLRPFPHSLALQPWREFWRRYVTLSGYRDGLHGLFLCLAMAWFCFLTYQRVARRNGVRWNLRLSS